MALKALILAFALLWQAASLPVAAAMGCCREAQPCCILASVGPGCATCTPAAALAPDQPAVPELRQAASVPQAGAEKPFDVPGRDIWRPPREALTFVQDTLFFHLQRQI
jgi:hypothetical protein